MTVFDTTNLNAPHTQRHLDEIPQSTASEPSGAGDLVKRLRDHSGYMPHNSVEADEAADRIEQLERELRVYMDAAEGHMVERMRVTDQLAAEKALADSYADGFRIGKSGGVIMRPAQVKAANAAYRKARGL